MLAMQRENLLFRATRDLDIVLTMEALDERFGKAFWEFVEAGGYAARKKSGRRQFYRFESPSDARYPEMLELFSRRPDLLDLAEGTHLTPIPMNDDVSSLSAILLDEAYYRLIQDGRHILNDLSIVRAEYLVPLKMRAWIDLSQRRDGGGAVDTKEIKKHRNDLFRLARLLSPRATLKLDPVVRGDMKMGLEILQRESGVDIKQFGWENTSADEVIAMMLQVYGPTIRTGSSEATEA